ACSELGRGLASGLAGATGAGGGGFGGIDRGSSKNTCTPEAGAGRLSLRRSGATTTATSRPACRTVETESSPTLAGERLSTGRSSRSGTGTKRLAGRGGGDGSWAGPGRGVRLGSARSNPAGDSRAICPPLVSLDVRQAMLSCQGAWGAVRANISSNFSSIVSQAYSRST